MVLITFKLRNINGSIPEEIIGRITRPEGVVPVVGNKLKLKQTLVEITEKIVDGEGFIMIVDKVNPNFPYIDQNTLRKNKKFRR